eukprot:scaffold3875_cov75-Phaeocystis_antarctica.AAC.3
MNEPRLNASDAPNEVNTELRASRVCSRLPASSASSDEQDGMLLKDRVTAMHERKHPTFHMIAGLTAAAERCCRPAMFKSRVYPVAVKNVVGDAAGRKDTDVAQLLA